MQPICSHHGSGSAEKRFEPALISRRPEAFEDREQLIPDDYQRQLCGQLTDVNLHD
jgi:hypothetical protein